MSALNDLSKVEEFKSKLLKTLIWAADFEFQYHCHILMNNIIVYSKELYRESAKGETDVKSK